MIFDSVNLLSLLKINIKFLEAFKFGILTTWQTYKNVNLWSLIFIVFFLTITDMSNSKTSLRDAHLVLKMKKLLSSRIFKNITDIFRLKHNFLLIMKNFLSCIIYGALERLAVPSLAVSRSRSARNE